MKIVLVVLMALLSFPLSAGENNLNSDWYRRYQSNRLIEFAQMFEGVRYDYANTDPMRGFDCSGFVQFVYGNFNVAVPRSSSQFAQFGKTISLADAEIGDILLFTGSNAQNKTPGHLGIISEKSNDEIKFLHSATSNARGIMQSSLSETYFKTRLIKVIRVL